MLWGPPTAASRVVPQTHLSSSIRASPAHESETAGGLPYGESLCCLHQLVFPWWSLGLVYDKGGQWPRRAPCPPVTFASLSLGKQRNRGVSCSQQSQGRLDHLPQCWLEHLPAPLLTSLPNCCSSHNVFIPGCPGTAAISLLEFITPLALKFYKPLGR